MILGEPKVVTWPKVVPLLRLVAGIIPVGVVKDVEEVGTEFDLQPLGDGESAAHGYVEVPLAGPIEGVASEIAELTAKCGAGGVGTGALEGRGVEVVHL